MSTSSQGGGLYNNTTNNRIKENLAKAQFLLDDPFASGGGNQDTTSNFGYGGDYGRGSGLPQPMLNKGYSVGTPMMGGGPMSYGGNTRS
jgi:hypothetical protein